MKSYQIKTTTNTEPLEAKSLDESDPHVVRFTLADGRVRSYSRATFISYEEIVPMTDAQREAWDRAVREADIPETYEPEE